MIIAVDFDGILCEDQFPEIGKPHYEMVSFVREMMDMGHEVVLWTSRVDKPLEDAVKWCEDRGLHFCAVNDNAPSNKERYKDQYPNGTRKVRADIYIDDHDVHTMWMLSNGHSEKIIRDIIIKVQEVIKWKQKKGN